MLILDTSCPAVVISEGLLVFESSPLQTSRPQIYRFGTSKLRDVSMILR